MSFSDRKGTICSRCSTVYDAKSWRCPVCHKLSSKSIILILFVFVVTVINFSFDNINLSFVASLDKELPAREVKQDIKQNVVKSGYNNADRKFEKLDIRSMSELSYLSADEILAQRTHYVRTSKIFGYPYYEPSPEVFQIEDGLPWISIEQITKYGTENNPNIGEGDSRHSLAINNPEILISFIIGNYSKNIDSNIITYADYIFPIRLYWDRTDNIIKVVFSVTPFFKKHTNYESILAHLETANAHDLGYKWAYCENFENVKFKNSDNNLSTDVQEMLGFYHKGYSCGLESGCNNYSPNQPELQVYLFGKPGYMRIKLWKEKPFSKDAEADLTYEMYLE